MPVWKEAGHGSRGGETGGLAQSSKSARGHWLGVTSIREQVFFPVFVPYASVIRGRPGNVFQKSWLEKVFTPAIESTFECTYTLACKPGEQVSFLKRMHRITESGVIVQAQSDLIHKMCDVVGISARKTSALPCSKEILKCSDSKPLEPDKATAFRTAIGHRHCYVHKQ